MIHYEPNRWYWKDATGRIFSSGAGAVVPADDAGYGAWLASGRLPTPWPKDEAGAQTPEALDEVLAPYGLKTGLAATSLDGLKTTALALASKSCAAVIAQIFPDDAHRLAIQTAGALASVGLAPTFEPIATKFAALAATNGMTADAFAKFVGAAQGANLDLSSALAVASTSIKAAADTAGLAAALTIFKSAVETVVAEINAAGPPRAIVAPASIVDPSA